MVNIWNDLQCYDIILYEIHKPGGRLPYTFVITEFESHLKFFHQIYSTDAFDGHGHFLGRLWAKLMPGQPYRPSEFDMSILEEDEPIIHRESAADVVMKVMNHMLLNHSE
jgi:hypothetical protein